MEEAFLKERLQRFLKVIPIEYKVADDVKKSPKGYTITLEREGKAKFQKVKETKEEEKVAPVEEAEKAQKPASKSKKKSLDELIDIGLN